MAPLCFGLLMAILAIVGCSLVRSALCFAYVSEAIFMVIKQAQVDSYTALSSGEKGDLLHSVQRALRVLSLIAEHPEGLSAREISKLLGLNISTCYHILNTLVATEFLDRHPQTQVYLLGPQIPFL